MAKAQGPKVLLNENFPFAVSAIETFLSFMLLSFRVVGLVNEVFCIGAFDCAGRFLLGLVNVDDILKLCPLLTPCPTLCPLQLSNLVGGSFHRRCLLDIRGHALVVVKVKYFKSLR